MAASILCRVTVPQLAAPLIYQLNIKLFKMAVCGTNVCGSSFNSNVVRRIRDILLLGVLIGI
jgi:hypothetical protein